MENIIIEPMPKGEYEVVVAGFFINLNDKSKLYEVVKELNEFYIHSGLDVISATKEIRMRVLIGRISHISGLSNNDCFNALIENLKKYLDIASIRVIENRLPLETKSYELKDA